MTETRETPAPAASATGDPVAIRVLMYHRIVDDESLCRAHWTCLHVSKFRRQIELLERWGYSSITLRDYELYARGEINLPARPVIITFDDGYLDTHTHAFPVLRESGMKAVVFVLGDRRLDTNAWDSGLGIPAAPLMDDDQVRELHRSGFEVGAHSMSHPDLTSLPPDSVWQELRHSRLTLEALLDDDVRSFAYPYGRTNETVKRLARDAGYAFACSVGSGPARFGADRSEIRRIEVRNTLSPAGFAVRLTAPYLRYAQWRWNVRQSLERANLRPRRTRGFRNDPTHQHGVTP